MSRTLEKIVSLFIEYSLYNSRVLDITKICELRDYDVKYHRKSNLFLNGYSTCSFKQDSEEALQKALELNSIFKEPLPVNEVKTDTKSAERELMSKRNISILMPSL